jgi:hypothetical protein
MPQIKGGTHEAHERGTNADALFGPFSPDYLGVCSGAGEVSPFTYWSYQANRRSRKSF